MMTREGGEGEKGSNIFFVFFLKGEEKGGKEKLLVFQTAR